MPNTALYVFRLHDCSVDDVVECVRQKVGCSLTVFQLKSFHVHFNSFVICVPVDFIDEWFLMGSPYPVLAISLAYIVFVKKIGPAFMENRRAYQLRTTMIVYNAVQVLYSGYIAWRGFSFLFEHGLITSKCVTADRQLQKEMTSTIYLYFLAKVIELLDTAFFILRKKKNQVTFLHVYHHWMMMLITWVTLKYDPTYSIFFIGIINSLVHVIMYAYYGLSAFPSLEKYLWWKKYITVMQLVQFMLMILQVGVSSYISECPPSYVLLVPIFFNVFLMIFLFSDFYLKSYIKKENTVVNSKNFHKKTSLDSVNGLPSTSRVLKSKGV